MKKWTIEYLRENNLIAYEYRRGSHMYHLNVATSDVDTGGVFICPPEMLEGLRSEYVEQVADEKNDTVFYEFGRWIELLLKSNPTALESLFAPQDCIIGPVHPAVQYVLDHKEMFLSKECFKTFYGYAVSQIGKARGLNKKIVNPVTERLGVLDFCYTYSEDGTGGSIPIKKWLDKYKLDQKYCGLVNVPNCRDTYALFYDFAAYFHFENIDWYDVSFQSGGVKSRTQSSSARKRPMSFTSVSKTSSSSATLALSSLSPLPSTNQTERKRSGPGSTSTKVTLVFGKSQTRFACAQSRRVRRCCVLCTTTKTHTPATAVTTLSTRSGRPSVTLFAMRAISATTTTART